MNEVKMFICGENKNHECNGDGPVIYFLREGGVTTDRKEAELKGNSGASVTCSICGEDAMSHSFWRGP